MSKTLKVIILLTLVSIMWITKSKTYCKYVIEDLKPIANVSIKNLQSEQENQDAF